MTFFFLLLGTSVHAVQANTLGNFHDIFHIQLLLKGIEEDGYLIKKVFEGMSKMYKEFFLQSIAAFEISWRFLKFWISHYILQSE